MKLLNARRLAASAVGLLALGACFSDDPFQPPEPKTGSVSQPVSGECGPVGCGNGIVEIGETCDDGNTDSGDGCNNACLKEPPNALPAEAVRLRTRAFTPDEPIEQAIVDAAAANIAEQVFELHAMAVFEERPETDSPAQWAQQGIVLEDSIHDNTFIVKLPLQADLEAQAQLEQLLSVLSAKYLVAFEPADKSEEALYAGQPPSWAVDPATGQLAVDVKFYRSVEESRLAAIANAFNASGTPELFVGEARAQIKLAPNNLNALVASPFVEWVEPGPPPSGLLMEAVRDNVNVSNSYRPNLCLTGEGVLISTIDETPSSLHDDFYRYDANGFQGASRILSGGTTSMPNSHAEHVVGIMVGNGWLSENAGGTPFQWRGIAPEAEYVSAYVNSSTLAPNITSASSIPFGFNADYDSMIATWDGRIRGDANVWYHHTQVWAAGNNGTGYSNGQGSGTGTRGNYAVASGGKNFITVGNIFAEDSRWAASSMGPTFDGRIKPDVSAPGCRMRHPYKNPEYDIDYIKVIRPGCSSPIEYTFDTLGELQGFEPANLWRKDIDGPTQIASPGGLATRWTLKPTRPHLEWTKYKPAGGSLTALADYYDGTVCGAGGSGDSIEIRYRYDELAMWDGGKIAFFWFDANTNHYTVVPVETDGNWHTLTINIGSETSYVGSEVVAFRLAPYAWNPGAVIATTPTDDYGGKCGTSMAAPAASGVTALLLDQLSQTHSIDLDSHAPSPFAWTSPSIGQPLPSTMKALLVHSARDLARVARDNDWIGADTGAPPEYHKGPDFTTGYGAVDAEEASRLIDLNAANALPIIERDAGGTHQYSLNVPANNSSPIRVTLAWDDAPASPLGIQHDKKLVNDLKLVLISPTGATHHPWSIDLPYLPNGCSTCTPPEINGDEPVVATDFVPARRDVENERDNVEMVFVETPEPGTWSVRVQSVSLPLGPQPYSLIIGQPPRPATDLGDGKVVFVSNRNGAPQLFLKVNDGSSTPPVQLPTMGPPREPEWSPDGRYIAYVTYEANFATDAIAVLDTVGSNHQYIVEPFASYKHLSNPSWSRDGSEIFVSYYNAPEDRGIGAVQSNGSNPRALYAPSGGYWSPDAPVDGGPDPTGVPYVIVHAIGGCAEQALFRIPVAGGDMDRLWADGFPSIRAHHPSVSRDGQNVLYASDDYQIGTPGFLDEEVVELTRFEGVTTRRTSVVGHQRASYAIGGFSEWVAETHPFALPNREIVLQQHGVQVPLATDDTNNSYDDYQPSWWKSNPNLPFAHPTAPALSCPASFSFAPQQWPNCTSHIPPSTSATSACGVPVQISVSPDVLIGSGVHTVTYTATDRLGNTASCETTIGTSCTGMPP